MDPAPLRPATRAGRLRAASPRCIGTDPRVIADDVWAKLLWAGLNLTADDLPASSAGAYYPMELVRAVTLTWLFAGLRSDEIARLRVGCIRWQHDGSPVAGDAADVLAADAVCLLDVPVHKTGTAFTKPVDPLLGQAIDAWQARAPRPAARPSTARPASTSTCCSPSAPTRSPRTTSTARSSRRSAARPASPPPTSAATSPATGPARPSPASSTTPRSR